MPTRRIRQKFEAWRQEPEHVRLRIATLLTAGSGAVFVVLWLAVLLPLQLHFSSPQQSDDVATALGEVADSAQDTFGSLRSGSTQGVVSGVRDEQVTPSPATDATYYHGTRPTRRRSDIFILASPNPRSSSTPTATISPTPATTPEPTSTPSDPTALIPAP